jgi:immunity region protein 2|nr:MAG TPA: IrrE protein [Caudoviricetes sp.]
MKYRNIIKKLVSESGTTNPEKLCKFLGIKIYYTKMNFMGFIVKINKVIHIFINSALSKIIKDIVILHELGHYFLHPIDDYLLMKDKFLFTENRIENEANSFAITAFNFLNNSYDYISENDLKILKKLKTYV